MDMNQQLMMNNGMPPAHMQRPQPGNEAQQIYQSIVEELRKNPTQAIGWQQTIEMRERANYIMQMVNSLRFLKNDILGCINIATKFESAQLHESVNKNVYVGAIRAKLGEIQHTRQAQLQSMGMMQTQNMAGMQPGMMPGMMPQTPMQQSRSNQGDMPMNFNPQFQNHMQASPMNTQAQTANMSNGNISQNMQQQQQQQQQPAVPQQKYACYAPAAQPRPPIYQPQCQTQAQPQYQSQPQCRPHVLPHTQSFNIPRRPVPQRKPQIIIQPSLQRTDSFATISRMPIANGSRPQDIPEQTSPAAGLSSVPQHGIYGNAGFSMSTPTFGATPTSPGLTYELATEPQGGASQTIDDNWETYGHGHGGGGLHYAPTVSTELGERDPPPPYTP